VSLFNVFSRYLSVIVYCFFDFLQTHISSVVDSHFENITANILDCYNRRENNRPWCKKQTSIYGSTCVNPNAAIGWKQPNGWWFSWS
jgi:hypothetical protein